MDKHVSPCFTGFNSTSCKVNGSKLKKKKQCRQFKCIYFLTLLEVFFDEEKKMKAAYQQRFQTFIELPVESLDFIHAA